MSGQRFADRFLLRARLGEGGLAEVFEATDEATGQRVALKVIHRHLAGDGALRERFKRELHAARLLSHPAIVRVFDLHEEGGRPAFSMELLEGETLAQRLARGPVPLEEAQRIAQALCAALGAAHACGVVHRDVKPQNVMLCRDGAVKLLDFGLSRVAGQARLTAQSVVMGTPGFIAPEVLDGRASDGRADLWSLGATLFELFTGKRAYPARDPFQALASQKLPPPSPRALRADLPEALDAAVRRALEPDPERRFLDAAQLGRALAGVPAPQAPPGPPVLTAGDCEVLVQDLGGAGDLEVDWRSLPKRLIGQAGAAALRAVAERLQVEDPAALALRLRAGGALATGLSERSAEEVVQLAQECGLATMIAPAQKPGRLHGLAAAVHWTRGRVLAAALGTGVLLTSLLGGAVLFWLGRLTQMSVRQVLLDADLRIGGVGFALLFGLLLAYPPTWELWRFLARAAFPAPGPNAAGDPAVAALQGRIERGLLALRAQAAASAPAQRMLLEELLRAAETAVAQGRAAAGRIAELPDPLAQPDDQVTLPAGLARPPEEERDSGMQRLLRLAAAMEDAVAASRRAGEAAAAEGLEPPALAQRTPSEGLAFPAPPADPASASVELRRVAEALGASSAQRDRGG